MNLVLLLMVSLISMGWYTQDITAVANQVEPVKEEPAIVVKPRKKEPLIWVFGDHTLELGARFRLENFYSKNATLLNDENGDLDKVIVPAKHTFDVASIYAYGCQSHGYDVLRLKASLRSKSTWGAPETIASTDDAFIKNADVVEGRHSHTINRHTLWIRELWIECVLNDMFNLKANNRYLFTGGFFPFQLGRGIALGDAYATDPDGLGYYYPNAIDQYAPGLKFSGNLTQDDKVSFDLYGAILHNKSNTFSNVNLKIRGQEYGRRLCPARGFGKINWLAAVRVKWQPIKNDKYAFLMEPYALYDDEREQKIEFVGDASSKLGTFGLALEARMNNFEIGFDMAQNVGRQTVKGWDRNNVTVEVRNGIFYEVNTDVTAISDNPATNDLAGKRAVFTPANQKIIISSPQNQDLNGLQIDSSNLKNGNDRFNNPYSNKLNGWMWVGDASYRFCNEIKMSLAAGIASGDENPNKDLDELNDSNIDGDYVGFIGLQETYSGTRVKSAFLLSGAGKVPRVLSFPSEDVSDLFPQTLSRFTNIVFIGWSSDIKACGWTINPNILNYWQEHDTRLFDAEAGQFSSDRFARNWLGIEINVFADIKLCNDVKLFIVAAAFLPGSFYSDIKGRPLSRDQQVFLNSLNTTGAQPTAFVPTVGNHTAYTFNMGIDYKF